MKPFGHSCKKAFYILNTLIPLLLGFGIYIAFRPDAIISKYTYALFGILPLSISLPYKWLQAVICGFSCDFLWAYSLTFVVGMIVGYTKRNRITVFLICLLFEVLIEILQLVGFIHGTFDIIDIIVELLAIFLALVLITKYEEYAK